MVDQIEPGLHLVIRVSDPVDSIVNFAAVGGARAALGRWDGAMIVPVKEQFLHRFTL